MRDDCTLLLSSYDNGEDCWDGFFTCLNDQWKEFDMPIVINTESKKYEFDGLNIKVIHPPKTDIPWGKRLINTLDNIHTDYVLLFLEDYWIDNRVDNDFFEQSLVWLKENDDVASFSYYPCLPGTNIDDKRFERFELRPEKCEYKLNCQASIWRRKDLISFIRPHETPWEWEVWGSIRATRYKKKFYVLKENEKMVFSYGDNLKGCIVHRGKWNKDAVIPLAKKYNLDIDYSIRGFEKWEPDGTVKRMPFIEALLLPHLIKRLWVRFTKPFRFLKSIV